MNALTTGDLAPDFELFTADNEIFSLAAHRGQPVLLFFYPADDTPGCTAENIEFTALLPDFTALGVTIAGISPDSVEKHRRFRERHALGVTLLADPDHKAILPFGVWQLKRNYGREYMGLVRTTFLIGADGRVAGIWRAARVKGHAAKVLDATRALLP